MSYCFKFRNLTKKCLVFLCEYCNILSQVYRVGKFFPLSLFAVIRTRPEIINETFSLLSNKFIFKDR